MSRPRSQELQTAGAAAAAAAALPPRQRRRRDGRGKGEPVFLPYGGALAICMHRQTDDNLHAILIWGTFVLFLEPQSLYQVKKK